MQTAESVTLRAFAKDAAQQSFELEDGMELILFGNISVYEPHGRYQLIERLLLRVARDAFNWPSKS